MLGGAIAEELQRNEPMKSHLSVILWSKRRTTKCSFAVLASGAVKFALRKPSPPEKSLGSGILAHSAAMAGLTPIPRGSRGVQPADPTEQRFPLLSKPLGWITFPAKGSCRHAPGSVTAVGFRL